MIELIYKINQAVVNPLIILLTAIALLMFLWGVFRFLFGFSQGVEKEGKTSYRSREEGKRAMLWGIIGLFIMVSVFGIIRVILNTFNIAPPTDVLPLSVVEFLLG